MARYVPIMSKGATDAQSLHTQASTIHIGAVMGIGYLATREEKFDLQSVSDMDPLGEAEFCTLVAEAVISGRTSSTPCDEDTSLTTISEIDIGTGIPELHHRFKDTLVFYTDPRFGNLKVPERRATTHSSSKTSVKEQLLVAKTLDEVRQAIISKNPCSFPSLYRIVFWELTISRWPLRETAKHPTSF